MIRSAIYANVLLLMPALLLTAMAQRSAAAEGDGISGLSLIPTHTLPGWPIHAAEGDGISGLWLGTYTYQESSPYKPSRFAMVLKLEDLAFSGKVIENNSFGDDTAAYLSADVMGELDDQGHVHFLHRYDGTGGQHHMVVYDGDLNDKKTVVTGTWSISEEWSGTFSMKLIEPYRRLEEPGEEAGAGAENVEAGGAPTAAPAAAPAPAPATPAPPSAQNF